MARLIRGRDSVAIIGKNPNGGFFTRRFDDESAAQAFADERGIPLTETTNKALRGYYGV